MAAMLEKQIMGINKEIEKYEIQLEKYLLQKEKQFNKLQKMGYVYISDERYVQDKQTLLHDKDNAIITSKQEDLAFKIFCLNGDIRDKERQIHKAYDRLEKLKVEQEEKEAKVNTWLQNKCEVIELFLDNWEKWMIENTEIEKELIQEERNRKALYIYYNIYNRVGKVLDATNLYISSDGNINGCITGEKGQVNVNTILAGGYNIQCLHYRVLFQVVK